MSTENKRKRRGRPKGIAYPLDAGRLAEIADLMVRDPRLSQKAAIRAIGVSGDSNIRRIERGLKANRSKLMSDALNRLRPAPTVSSEVSQRPASAKDWSKHWLAQQDTFTQWKYRHDRLTGLAAKVGKFD